MGYHVPDMYGQPEAFGLTLVGCASDDTMDYQFDMFAVWQDRDGVFYWAEDSGCSCPSPFENFTRLDYEDVTKGTASQCHGALDDWTTRATETEAADLHHQIASAEGSVTKLAA